MRRISNFLSGGKTKNRNFLLVFGIFAIFGGFAIVRSFAATVTTINAEEIPFSLKGVGQDSSKGKFAALYWKTSGTVKTSLPTTTTELKVSAKGDPCYGAPLLVVKIDGEQVMSQQVSDTNWNNYSVPVNLKSGEYDVSVSFVNDIWIPYGKNTCDRNLYIDTLSFVGKDSELLDIASIGGKSLSYSASSNSFINEPKGSEKSLAMFWNGTAEGNISLATKATGVDLYIKGTKCDGVPTIIFNVDNKNIAKKDIKFDGWGQINIPVALSGGNHKVELSFINDRSGISVKEGRVCDRNVFVNKIVFRGPAPEKTPQTKLPAAPTNLKVLSYIDGTVTLQATVDSNTATAGLGYKINSSTGPPVTDSPRNSTTVNFKINNIKPRDTLVLKVAGKNAAGIGPESKALTYTAPIVDPANPTGGIAYTSNIVGMHGGARDIDYRATSKLGAKLVRVGGLDAKTSRSEIQKIADQYAKTGTKIIALVDFNGSAPSEADSLNIGTWADVKGVEAIEFGNEPWLQNEAWDYAQYARSYKAAYDAVKVANPNMTLIAVGDSANRSHRPGLRVLQELKNLGIKPKAIQIHPYGPDYMNRLNDARRDLSDVGWSTGVEIWVTEVGLSTDDGKTMYQGSAPNNYGWDPSMNYTEAAKTIKQITGDLLDAGVSKIILYNGTDYRKHGESNQREHYFGLTTYEGDYKGEFSSVAKTLFAK